MKNTFLPFFLIFLISCNQNVSRSTNNFPTPISKPTSSTFEKNGKSHNAEKDIQELEKFIEIESKYHKISALKDKKLPSAGIEIRVWRFSAFGDKNLIFVLENTKGNWSAKVIQRTITEKDIAKNNPPMKFSTKQLGEPKSGWEILWKKLNDAKILILPNGSEVGNEPSPDSWAFVVETKVENKYRAFEYQMPEHDDSEESQQMTKIVNIISEEFNLNDFNEENFLQP